MTTLVCDFIDIIGEPIDGVASLSTGEVRPDYSNRSVKVPHPVSETVVAGQATFSNVRPGKAVLTVHWEGRSATFRFTVPDTESISLIDAVAGEGMEQSELDEFRAGIAAEFENTRNVVIEAATTAEDAAASATSSASAAASSATAANSSRSSAASSATAASQSAAAASTSATNAATSAANAKTSETRAKTSETNAKTSETNAQTAAYSAEADRLAVEQAATSASWSGDRLTVLGATSPSLKGDKGDKGDPGDGSGDVLWSELTPALDGKAPVSHTHTAAQISDATTTGRNVLKASSQSAARSAIGAGTSNLALGTTSSTAAAGNHTHTASDVGAAPASHTHDDRYYTKGQADGRYVSTSGTSTKTGDLNMDGGSVSYIRPDTTGGWARGFYWKDRDQTTLAGIGALGGASGVSNIYIGYGGEGWSNPVFRAYKDRVSITNLEVTGAVTGNAASKAYVDARTPEIRVVSSLPASPSAGVVYLVTG